MYGYLILFFVLGLIFGFIFTNIGYRLPIDKSLLEKSKCDCCNHTLSFKEKIPVISYFLQKRKCRYCLQKISVMYIIFELLTGILFALIYLRFSNYTNTYINIALALVFISTLIIIMISDIKYMLIPDELLIVSSSLVIVLRIFLGFISEEITGLLDAGYMIMFMLLDAAIMFAIMFVIKKLGDILFKKESLGGGDVKMMAFVSLLIGYKLSIIVIFLASFIALPFSIYNAYKKSEIMLPFGPYLAIATIILYIFNIDMNTIIELIH